MTRCRPPASPFAARSHRIAGMSSSCTAARWPAPTMRSRGWRCSPPRRTRAMKSSNARWSSSVRACRACAWRCSCAAPAAPTSSSSSNRPGWAAPGGTTAIPARMSTCRRRCTPSPSRPTRAGRAALPLRRRSRPTCRTWPSVSACCRTSASAGASSAPRSTRPTAAGASNWTTAARCVRGISSAAPGRCHARACRTSRASRVSPAACCIRRAGSHPSTPPASAWA